RIADSERLSSEAPYDGAPLDRRISRQLFTTSPAARLRTAPRISHCALDLSPHRRTGISLRARAGKSRNLQRLTRSDLGAKFRREGGGVSWMRTARSDRRSNGRCGRARVRSSCCAAGQHQALGLFTRACAEWIANPASG